MTQACRTTCFRGRGFTLTELLIVIGLISLLAVLTLVSMRAITRDARLASATNTVTAVLDNARALAMKKNELVMVVFRPRQDAPGEQVVDAVTAAWTGESLPVDLDGDGDLEVVDRFAPIPDVAIRTLPEGVKVAAPSYGGDYYTMGVDSDFFNDALWITQSHLPAMANPPGEVRGAVIGVMYGPDGTTLSLNPHTDADRSFVDFDDNQQQHDNGAELDYVNQFPNLSYFEQARQRDEPFVVIAPFLAVYDDAEARALKTLDWSHSPAGRANYVAELAGPQGYISRLADRIHFNRYTGVAMR